MSCPINAFRVTVAKPIDRKNTQTSGAVDSSEVMKLKPKSSHALAARSSMGHSALFARSGRVAIFRQFWDGDLGVGHCDRRTNKLVTGLLLKLVLPASGKHPNVIAANATKDTIYTRGSLW